MAEGGAAARRMRVRRVALAWAHKYLAQDPLGTGDRPRVVGLPRRACTVWYGGRPTGRARRRARTGCQHVQGYTIQLNPL
jgi:hypothetical protein